MKSSLIALRGKPNLGPRPVTFQALRPISGMQRQALRNFVDLLAVTMHTESHEIERLRRHTGDRGVASAASWPVAKSSFV